jgi:hypothetical protein
MKLILFRYIFEKYTNTNCSVGTDLFHADRRTEGLKDGRRDEKTEGGRDRNDAANSRFEQFCESS